LARTFTALVLKGTYCHVCGCTKDVDGWSHAIGVGSCKIGFRYFALRVGDKARMLRRITNGTKNQGRLAHIFIDLSLLFFLDRWVNVSFMPYQFRLCPL